MKRSVALIVLIVMCLISFSAQLYAWPVPDTGQQKCYDAEGNEIAPCPEPGEPFYGQDANYNINPMSYTKLDANGNELPDSAESWAMVRDNVTGLIWEEKTNKDDVENYGDPHDADNRYSWYDPDPATNGGHAGTESDHDTVDYIEALNNANFGGHSDWRLPSKRELQSIVNYSVPNLAVDVSFFANTVPFDYWSSTTYANKEETAGIVRFSYGADDYFPKSHWHHVRAVRGGQGRSFDSWIIHENNTATHEASGLMWQTNEAGEMTWQEALMYCENLVLGGYTDWRLPTINELISISKSDTYDPAADKTVFPNIIVSSDYWSSTTRASNGADAWYVNFYGGYDAFYYKYSSLYVRAVHGGQFNVSGKSVVAQTPTH